VIPICDGTTALPSSTNEPLKPQEVDAAELTATTRQLGTCVIHFVRWTISAAQGTHRAFELSRAAQSIGSDRTIRCPHRVPLRLYPGAVLWRPERIANHALVASRNYRLFSEATAAFRDG
jgi:hypothetical protein